jgi:hypothetical protein
MTIKQLIEKLKQYPPDMRVIISGYEDGYNDISNIEEKEIAIDIISDWYNGQHVDSDDQYRLEEIENPIIEKALLLDGKNLIAK